jgi:DNA-binding PadR family transcriptional regulator/polyisoprenoid-binding protein YceI
VPRLRDLRFGRVDRPAVYRALAQLQRDQLVAVTAEHADSGQMRRVYSVTPLGERVLRVWIGVIREEHALLGEVVRRYQATGTTDALLAEIEGRRDPELDAVWSSVSTTSMWRRRLMPVDTEEVAHGADDEGERDLSPGSQWATPDPSASSDFGSAGADHVHRGSVAGEVEEERPVLRRFALDPERSAVIIDARSTVGPISFGTAGVHGSLYAALVDGAVSMERAPSGWLTIDVAGLSSGNKLYDAELQRRIDARRFPTARVELRECAPSAPGARYSLRGELTFHGITRAAQGTVNVDTGTENRLVIDGEQVFDIRDFDLPSPTMLMLRIFPDVRVRLHAEAVRDEDEDVA